MKTMRKWKKPLLLTGLLAGTYLPATVTCNVPTPDVVVNVRDYDDHDDCYYYRDCDDGYYFFDVYYDD